MCRDRAGTGAYFEPASPAFEFFASVAAALWNVTPQREPCPLQCWEGGRRGLTDKPQLSSSAIWVSYQLGSLFFTHAANNAPKAILSLEASIAQQIWFCLARLPKPICSKNVIPRVSFERKSLKFCSPTHNWLILRTSREWTIWSN